MSVQQRTQRKCQRIRVYLRSQHADYLEHIARRDEVPISVVVDQIIRATAGVLDPPVRPPLQENYQVTIEGDNFQLLNCLSRSLGTDRSEVMRRLIEKAMTEDPILRLAV